MQHFHNPLGFRSSRLVFNHETPESSPKSAAERRAESTREIIDDAKKTRLSIQGAEITEKAIETDERSKHLLKEDTSILISQKGSGSKHNEAGWKGLALTTDDVTILDYNTRKINGKEYVKVKLNHKIGGVKNRYRTYVGYIEKEAFKDSPDVQRLKAMKEGYEKAQVEMEKENKIKKEVKALNKKFVKLFEQYKPVNASYANSVHQNQDNSWTIEYNSTDANLKNHNLIKLHIDTTQEPYEYTINGMHTRSADDAYLVAENILKREI